MWATKIAVAVLGLTLLSACTADEGADPAPSGTSAPAPSGTPAPELGGTSWNLTAYAGAGGAQTPAVTDPSVGTLDFLADGRLAGSTGCNGFSGTYEQSGADLTIATEAVTWAACLGPAGEQDASVIAALDKVATAGVAADQLVLKDAQGAQLLLYAPGLAGLEGTSWTAISIKTDNQAVASGATVTTITAEFGKDNALSGFGGCNDYTSTWTTTAPDGLTIGPLGATLVGCEQDVQDTENQYFAALAQVSTYKIEGNQLSLHDSDAAVQVAFTLNTD